MRIYPSITEHFQSDLTPDQLLHRVESNTAAPFSWSRQSEPFRGSVAATSFKLRRITWFTNVSSRPQIEGWVELNGLGSTLRVRHRLHPLGFWFGTLITILISLFLTAIAVDAGNSLLYLFPIGALMLGIGSVLIPFWFAVHESRGRLVKLLELELITSPRPSKTAFVTHAQ